MPQYNAPLRDLRFVLHQVFDGPGLWARLPALAGHIDADTADAILEEAAKVTGNLIAPLNRSGDEEGARWQEGAVITPAGFRGAGPLPENTATVSFDEVTDPLPIPEPAASVEIDKTLRSES